MKNRAQIPKTPPKSLKIKTGAPQLDGGEQLPCTMLIW